MGNIDRAELEKKLEEIITLLEKRGLIPTLKPSEKKELIQQVSETLRKDPDISLSKDDLKNEDIQKGLGAACISQLLMTKDSKYRFDYTLLFKPQMSLNPEKLQKELKLLYTNALKLNPEYQNKPKPEQNLVEAGINTLCKDIANLMKKDDPALLVQNGKLMDFVGGGLDLLGEQRRSLYGVDTHKPGATVKPVLYNPGDNGILNLATSGGESFMAKKNDPTGPDPTGARMATLINFLMDNNTTAYEQYLKNENVIPGNEPKRPTPFSTKPEPRS